MVARSPLLLGGLPRVSPVVLLSRNRLSARSDSFSSEACHEQRHSTMEAAEEGTAAGGRSVAAPRCAHLRPLRPGVGFPLQLWAKEIQLRGSHRCWFNGTGRG